MISTPARREFLAGVRAQFPILLGVAPFGMIFGALAVAAGITPLAAQGLSLFVFAGSAQFISVGLIADGVSVPVVVLSILVVNLRHALYSATMAPHWRPLAARWKAALAWLLTDEAFVVTAARYREEDKTWAHWFMLGTGLILWATWQASTTIGILLGALTPESLALDFALPLTFLALLIPLLTDRAMAAATISAGLVAVGLAGLPYKLGLLLATLAGVGVGLGTERLRAARALAGGCPK